MNLDRPPLQHFLDRLFAPVRPALDAVIDIPEPPRGSVLGRRGQRWMAEFNQHLVGAADRWEALIARGILPDDWADDPLRRFVGERCASVNAADNTLTFAPVRDLPHPPSVDEVLTIGCDPAGILAAEALARDAARRLAPWSLLPIGDVAVWRVIPSATRRDPGLWFLLFPRMALIASVRIEGELDLAERLGPWATPTEVLNRPPLLERRASVRSIYTGATTWEVAAATGLRVPRRYGGTSFPDAVVGRRFAEFPNPFDPLLGVIEHGYFCEDLAAEILLLAPQL